MSLALLAVAVLTVVAAGALQRVTGIGYALVAGPTLLVAVGPDEAVRLVTVTSVVTCAIALASTWRYCRWAEVSVLLPFAFLAMWPAGLFAAAVGEAVASVLSGFVVLGALAIALRPHRLDTLPRWPQAVVAGGLSGAMNAVAAIGGPMAAAYGISRRWGSALVPNLQVLLLLSAFGVLLVRGWPARTSDLQLVVLMLAAGGGVVAGEWLSGRVPRRRAGALTACVAVLGASVAIMRGAAGVLG